MYATFDNQAEGAAVTASSGNGDDFLSIASSMTAAAAAIPWGGIGAMGAKRTVTGTASQSTFQMASTTGTLATRIVSSFYFKIPGGSAVTTNAVIATIDTQSTGSQALQLKLTTTKKLRLAPSSTEIGAGASDSNTLVDDTWYYVQFAATAGTTTTNGIAELNVLTLAGASHMPAGTPYVNSAVDCKQAELGRGRYGGLTTAITTGWTDEYMSDPQLVRISSGWQSPIRRDTFAPQYVLSGSGYTATGGSNPAVMQDSSDSTYIDGLGTQAFLLNPLTSGTQLDVTIRHLWATANPTTKTLELLSGPSGSTLKTWTLTPGSTVAAQALTANAGELTGLDWDHPVLELGSAA